MVYRTQKYIANYKARLDSLLLYQKKLNQIIEFYLQSPLQILYPDTIIKAVAELHRIELSMFNIWKQLPELDIVEHIRQPEISEPIFDAEDVNGLKSKPETESEAWCSPEDNYVQCSRSCQRWFRKYTIKYHESKCVPKIEVNE